MMRRSTAALYLDMTVADLEREMIEGRVPMPVMFGGELRWSRTQLDESLERLTGDAKPDWRKKAPLYASRS